MKVDTLRFGEIEVEEDRIILFEQGIPGFESFRRFVILHPDDSLPLDFIQSLDDGNVAFMVTNPFDFFPDYQFELPEPVQHALGIEGESDVMLCSVLSIGDEEDLYLNLIAPIVINTRLRKGTQVILHQTDYSTKHRVPVMRRQEEEEQAVGGE